MKKCHICIRIKPIYPKTYTTIYCGAFNDGVVAYGKHYQSIVFLTFVSKVYIFHLIIFESEKCKM